MSLDLLCRLSAEVGLDKPLALSYDAVLAVGSGEREGGDLCEDGEESASSSCSGRPVMTEWFVGLVMTELVSRRISAQRQLSWC